MNIILFCREEVQLPLPRHDPRAVHLLTTLRRRPGDLFDAGMIDGPRGKGRLVAVNELDLALAFTWSEPPPPLCPVTLIVGLPRPQTARDILREAASLGVSAMHFVLTDRGEAGYASSSLWKSGDWKECVINGVAQAFCTRLPKVTSGQTLAVTLESIPPDHARVALDNYEAPLAFSRLQLDPSRPITLAIGSERGWTEAERRQLRASGFLFAHLGERVLRTETAVIAAITLAKARLSLT